MPIVFAAVTDAFVDDDVVEADVVVVVLDDS